MNNKITGNALRVSSPADAEIKIIPGKRVRFRITDLDAYVVKSSITELVWPQIITFPSLFAPAYKTTITYFVEGDTGETREQVIYRRIDDERLQKLLSTEPSVINLFDFVPPAEGWRRV